VRGESRRVKEKYWQGLVAEWQGSSLSVNEFCRKKGIAPSSFGYWRKRTRSKGQEQVARVFLPVRVSDAAGDRKDTAESYWNGRVEILVAGRYPVRVTGEFTPAVLDSVITVLEGRVC